MFGTYRVVPSDRRFIHAIHQAGRESDYRRSPGTSLLDDIRYELYVKRKIEEGLADIEAGRSILHEQLEAELLGNGDSMVETRQG
uniref:Uncharacterized protein n=1 Tax=Candidatus Kentrum sp. TC TaxID=2126339 RepID=A0A450ZDV6_9GAMM|nr:MAG: hypothetical protein BECKTC1821D_GA0114238_11484 [Candidatus Kentron sp. TC]VFK61172.1 MAG: hypothetical protein BECKTC1821F_GA0114240_10552 [Candidatus Kentron sp. TC]